MDMADGQSQERRKDTMFDLEAFIADSRPPPLPTQADRQFVVPAKAGTQGQATETPGFPLSLERRTKAANDCNFRITGQARDD
jgi:hypothetical protein